MKKLFLTTFVVMLAVSMGYCGGKSLQEYNYDIPDGLYSLASDGALSVTGGIVNVHETWATPPAKSATLIQTAAVSTATLVASATTWTLAATDLTDIVHPRNLTAIAVFTEGNSTSTFTGSLAIVGVGARGQAVTETITFSTNTGTGNEAYSSVTSATLTTTVITTSNNATVTINIGNGDKLGLSNNVTALTDVYKIVEGDAKLAVSANSISLTFDTYITSDIPDGSDNFEIWYKAISR